jgi:N-methylhydantoinase A
MVMSDPVLAQLNQSFAELEQRAHDFATMGGLTLRRSLEVRFTHQSVRLRVTIPPGPIDRAVIAEAEAQFRSDYFVLTGINSTDSCTILNCWVDAVATVSKPPSHRPMGDISGIAFKGSRQAYFPGSGFIATPVHDREKLLPGTAIEGPVLLEEPESTLVVPPGFALHMDVFGNILVEHSSKRE